MNKIKTLALIALFSASLGLSDTGTQGESSSVADGFLSAGDLVVVRPISTAATIGAFGIFALVAPFTEIMVLVKVINQEIVSLIGLNKTMIV